MLLKDVQEEQRQSTKNLVFHGKTQNSMWSCTLWGKFNKEDEISLQYWNLEEGRPISRYFYKAISKRKFENLA
jgi:hypothetical protein